MTESKIIVVTGASSGIGEAVAQRLAADGHHVVAGARREDRLDDLAARIREAGGSIETRRLDVTDRADVAAFVDATVAAHGRVDVVVNNAGVMPLSRLDAGLVDTLHISVAPVELGRGERLWRGPEDLDDRYHHDAVPSSSGVTHHLYWRD